MNPNYGTIRKILLASSILIACFAVFVALSDKQEAKADINPMLNFTGKVTDSDSAAVADNVYDFSFGLYTTATSGAAIWSEDLTAANLFSGAISAVSVGASSTTYTYTGGSATSTLRVGQYLTNASTTEYELITAYSHASNQVTVATTTAWTATEGINNRPRTEGGVVDIDLGSVSDLSSENFNQTLYLQVTFNSEVMQPRKLITAVAQAFNADKLDGYDASDFANVADDITVTGEWDFANVLDIATSSATTALTVKQSGNGDIINIFDGLIEVFTITDGGYVGIGTTTPYSKLSIWGSGNLLELVDTSSTTVFRVDDSGDLTITGTTTMGALTYPSYDGTAGQAILTDSNGKLYWGDSTGAGTVQTGLAGRLAFYPSDGIIVNDTDYLFWDDTSDRFGIGTTAPSMLLTVGSSTPQYIPSADRYRSAYIAGLFEIGGTGTSTIAGDLDIKQGLDVGGLYINSSGAVTAGTWQGTAISDAYISSAATWNAKWDALSDMALATGNIYVGDGSSDPTATTSLYIHTNQYIGIATTTPAYQLDVNGDLRVTTGNNIILGSTQWNSGDKIDGTKLAVAGEADQDLLFYNSSAWDNFAKHGSAGVLITNTAGNLAWSATSTWDTNANTICSGSTTYLDGDGNCDDISGVYVQAADWTTIDNYPSACAAGGGVVTGLGDTLTCTATSSLGLVTIGGAFHDSFSDYVANEHIDWTAGSAGTIHTDNYIEDVPHTSIAMLNALFTSETLASTTNVWADAYISSAATWNAKWDALSDMALATGNIYVGDGSSDPTATSSLYVHTNQYIGIATTTPAYQLDVNGDLRVTTGNNIILGSTQWNSGDKIDGTKLAVAGEADQDLLFYNSSAWDNFAKHGSAGVLITNTAGNLAWSATSSWSTTYTAGDHLTLTGTDFDVDDDFLLNTGDAATGNYTFADDLAVSGATTLSTTTMSVWNNVVVVDGVHYSQDGAGIQAAINAAGTSSKVFLPAGTYNITTTITVPSNIWIEGAGASSTILYADGINASVIQNSDTTNGNSHIKISNLKIDGNDTGNSAGHGIYFNKVTYSHVDSVYVYDADDHGIYLLFSASSTISHNILESNENGIKLLSTNNSTLINNLVNNNTYEGIYIWSSSDNTIVGNIINNNGEHGIYVYASAFRNTIVGNIIKSNTANGIYLYIAHENAITGNSIYNNGGSGAGYDGIQLYSSDSNLISSNRITDTAGTGYAIQITSAASENNVLVGNYYSGTGASSINDAGTNTRYTQPERLTITTSNLGEVAYSPFFIHASSSVALLSVKQDSTGDIVNIFDGADEVFTILDGGNIGIGTSTPYSKLTVWGASGNLLELVADTGSTTVFAVNTDGDLTMTGTTTMGVVVYPNYSGAVNEILYTDGSGNLAWTATSSWSTTYTAGDHLTLTGTDFDVDDDFLLNTGDAATGNYTFADDLAVAGATTLSTTTMSVWNNVVVVDGVHYSQDGAGIQAAINALPAEGGKVFIPEGTYSMTATTTIPSNVWLEGAGASSTILYLADGANTAVLTNSDWTNGNSHIKISNLKIDGNDANNEGAYCHGIRFTEITHSEIESIYVYDADDAGVSLSGGSSVIYNIVKNSYIESNGSEGISINGAYNNISNNVLISNNVNINTSEGWYNVIKGNYVYNSTADGIIIYNGSGSSIVGNRIRNSGDDGITVRYSSGNSKNITVTGNSVYNSTGHGLKIEGNNHTISGNIIVENKKHGINITANDSVVTGNMIRENDKDNSQDYDGIYANGADYTIISNNRLAENDRYEINISSTCDYTIVEGNYTYGSDHVGEINDDSATTIYNTQLVSNDLILKSAGNVGIGTTSPCSKLTVWGGTGNLLELVDTASTSVFAVNTDGDLTMTGTTTMGVVVYPNYSGAVNEILYTDGSGNLAWTATSSWSTAYTADNGLTLSGATFKLGGTLSADTTITQGNFGMIFNLDGTGDFDIQDNGSSAFFVRDDGLVGIGTTSPQTLLTVYKSDNDALISFGDQNSNTAHWFMGIDYDDSAKFKIASSSLLSIAEFTFTKGGYLGIGTTSPQAALHIGAASTSNLTTYGNSLFVAGELEVGETAYLGPMEFGADSGVVSWIDMPVTSSASVGTVESYTARIDGTNLLTIYSESDGSGSIQNTGVGIGTTTPFGFLSVSASSTGPALVVQQVDSGNQGPIAVFYDGASEVMRLDSSGNLGIGTTSPTKQLSLSNLLYVGGTGTSTIENNLEILGALQVGSGSLYIDSDSIENLSGNLILQPSSGYVGIGTSSPLTTLSVQGTAGTPIMNIASSTGASVLYVDEYDRVGIGTTSPAYTLDVSGNVRATLSVSAGINVETLSAAKTLTPGVDEMHQYLDEGGADRIINLATAGAIAGDRFIIRHNGAYDDAHYLRVKQSEAVLDQIYSGAIKEFIFDGTNWISGETGAGEDDNKKWNVALGYLAKGYSRGAAVGYSTKGYNEGTAVGYGADGYDRGAAVGYGAAGYNDGAAVGYQAEGYNRGVAVGRGADGYNYGAAIGYGAKSSQYGFSAGYSAGTNIDNAGSVGNILIGRDAGDVITTGDYNIIIGHQVDGLNATANSFLNIGDTIYGDLSAGKVGIGTTTPYSKLTVWGDGTSGLSAFSVVDSASSTLFTVLDNGYVGIGTASPSYNLEVVGTVSFGSDTGGDIIFDTTTITNQVLVGIGTSTPDADLTIVSDQVNSNTNLFTIATSTSGSDAINRKFIVDSDGDIFYDGSATSPAADYAEYFWTADTDLESGEVVCVDVTKENAVKRCERGADGNVMGIVSTNPAIVGNAPALTPGPSPAAAGEGSYANYVIVGLLGQVPAKVSTENGEIRPGDSLTSASSTPGYVMRAEPGDPTVGIALSSLTPGPSPAAAGEGSLADEDGGVEMDNGLQKGVINVLISRRNKSLTVEMVERKITDRIAAMEIEDEVQILIARAVDNINLDSEIQVIVDEQMALVSADLTVEVDAVSGELMAIAVSVDELIARMNIVERDILDLRLQISNFQLPISNSIVIDEYGNIKMGSVKGAKSPIGDLAPASSTVAVVEIITATTTNQTAFVVNQQGDGDVADFRADGVSVVNIGETGRVTIVGEMLVDGRIMVCSGSGCGSALDERVDETMGDMGVEGTIVAGAFEGYCEDGFVWVSGSAKYGTLPGFCVMSSLTPGPSPAAAGEGSLPGNVWVDISQGEAILACQGLGDGYHLISENEWLTIAENIIRINDNDINKELDGLQLATTTIATTSEFILSNGNVIYDLVGEIGEWTDQTVTRAGLLEPISDEWQEYYEIEDYNGFNIAPPYYYSSENGIGRVKTGNGEDVLRGFVRGTDGIYSLDLSYSPTTATSSIGFRCAK